jgi:TRAP-type C4-dicarboxylate transport system permease small subunit
VLTALERHAGRVARLLALAAATCLLGVALLTMGDILLRWLFKAPIKGLQDITALACAVIVAAYFPALLARRGNVTIRLFGSFIGSRGTRLLETFGALVTAVFFALMTWKYVEHSAELTRAGESTVVLRWPTGPWWWVVTAMIAITALVALIVLAREMVGRGGDTARRH